MIDKLKAFTSVHGVSGFEEEIRAYIINEISDYADEIKVDRRGNLLCYKKGKKSPTKKLMYAAHMDEVGLYINSIDGDGFLHFDAIGMSTNVLIGKQVLVGKKRVRGVIGTKPIHLLKPDERTQYPKTAGLYIDIGADSKEEADEYYAQYAVFDTEFKCVGDTVCMKAFDDRIGCMLLCELIKSELEYDSFFAFTVGEEIGAKGIGAAVNRIKPDVCIVVEGTTAQDTQGSKGAEAVCRLGGGAVIPFMDRGAYYDRKLYNDICKLADKNGIRHQTKTVVAGGTDAQVIQIENAGTRVLAISLPCRYIHSATTLCRISDAEEMKKLLLAADKHFEELII